MTLRPISTQNNEFLLVEMYDGFVAELELGNQPNTPGLALAIYCYATSIILIKQKFGSLR